MANNSPTPTEKGQPDKPFPTYDFVATEPSTGAAVLFHFMRLNGSWFIYVGPAGASASQSGDPDDEDQPAGPQGKRVVRNLHVAMPSFRGDKAKRPGGAATADSVSAASTVMGSTEDLGSVIAPVLSSAPWCGVPVHLSCNLESLGAVSSAAPEAFSLIQTFVLRECKNFFQIWGETEEAVKSGVSLSQVERGELIAEALGG